MPQRFVYRIVVSPLLLLAGLMLCGQLAPAAEPAVDPLAFQTVAPLLKKHCGECHGEKKQEAEINFVAFGDLPSILSRRDLWRKAQAALKNEEMPPDPEASGFTDKDRAALAGWIHDKIEIIDRNSPIYADPGPPLVRQLTRAEYNNTLKDLLKIDFNAADSAGITSEDVAEGFTNMAGGQLVDEPLLEKYFTAAETALTWVFEKDPKQNGKVKAARDYLLVTREPGPEKTAEKLSDRDAAKATLEKFAKRAFRRPVEAEETERLLAIFDRATKAGDNFEQAVRKAMKPVLVSPHFLLRVERDSNSAKPGEAFRISDYELATRLSYFLWATMPDDELLQAADAGNLSKPEILDAQVKRMLASPKASAITEYFGVQWLQLKRLQRALPERKFFPVYTPQLKGAMEQEVRQFFDGLRTEDRSVLDLIDADYTYANEELAKYYGLPDVKGEKFRKVTLRPEDHRGGLLGMSGILTMTSHTDRTKPTSRGKWILDVVLGTPPAPPPADAGELKTPKDKPEPKTFREKLAMHASKASCAACHKKIDPLGFALENYDAIGGWREQTGGQPVDNLGKLPGGDEFHGPAGLKQILHAQQDKFVRNLSSQLLTYALGRHTEYYDEVAIADITERLEKNDYRFSELVKGVVSIQPFQYRKSIEEEKK